MKGINFLKSEGYSPATLTRSYILALSLIAILAIAAQIIIQYALNHQLKDAYVVNMAGRQRMLSQRITKNCILLQTADSVSRKKIEIQLVKDLSNWERFHYYFLNGEKDVYYNGDSSHSLEQLYAQIHPSFKKISVSSHKIIRYLSIPGSDPYIKNEVAVILTNEGRFLRGMNSIVFKYEEIAERKVSRLKDIEELLFCFTLILLLFEGFFVFRPAMQKIHSVISELRHSRKETELYNLQLVEAQKQLSRANEELEQKVEDRTRDLDLQKQELKEKNELLEKLNKDLDNFVYSASHDLRAPLNNLEGLINGLFLNLPEATIKAPEFTELINHSIHNFKYLLDQLSDTAKARKVAEGEVSKVKIADVLEEIELTLHEELQKYHGCIEADFSFVPEIRISEKNLRSILYNLISNGIKYRSGTRNPVVKVKTGILEDFVVLTVQDNGLGIPAENIEQIFTIYTRLHDHVEGTGVGMSLVKKIVENEGGRIEVESKVEVGSIFRIYFPREPEVVQVNN